MRVGDAPPRPLQLSCHRSSRLPAPRPSRLTATTGRPEPRRRCSSSRRRPESVRLPAKRRRPRRRLARQEGPAPPRRTCGLWTGCGAIRREGSRESGDRGDAQCLRDRSSRVPDDEFHAVRPGGRLASGRGVGSGGERLGLLALSVRHLPALLSLCDWPLSCYWPLSLCDRKLLHQARGAADARHGAGAHGTDKRQRGGNCGCVELATRERRTSPSFFANTAMATNRRRKHVHDTPDAPSKSVGSVSQ